MAQTRRERAVLAGDLNGKNVAWGGLVTDDRGVEIQDRTVMNGWNIENSPHDPPSFCSNRGRSWVDLVLSKGVRVRERVVEDDESLSDHCHISYELEVERLSRGVGRVRYEVKGVDWERYERVVREVWEERGHDLRQEGGGTEGKCTLLQGVVREACGRVMRRKVGRGRERKEWWTDGRKEGNQEG